MTVGQRGRLGGWRLLCSAVIYSDQVRCCWFIVSKRFITNHTFLLMSAKCAKKLLDIFWSSTVSHSMATTLLLISKVDIMNVSKIWFVRQRSKESNIFAWHNNICFTVFLSKVFGLSWSCFCLALATCFAVWSLKVDGVFVKLKQEPGPEEDQLFSCSQSSAKKWRCQTFGGKHATNLWAKYLWREQSIDWKHTGSSRLNGKL